MSNYTILDITRAEYESALKQGNMDVVKSYEHNLEAEKNFMEYRRKQAIEFIRSKEESERSRELEKALISLSKRGTL